MVRNLPLVLVGMMLTAVALPGPAHAHGGLPDSCIATTLAGCEFHCHVGDIISVAVENLTGANVAGSSTCDGMDAFCVEIDGFCFQNAGYVLTAATGYCKISQGTSAICSNDPY